MHATAYAQQSIWTVVFTLRFCDFSCDTGKEGSWQSAKLPQGLKTTTQGSFFWWPDISLFFSINVWKPSIQFEISEKFIIFVGNMQFQVGTLIFNAIFWKVFEILRIFNLCLFSTFWQQNIINYFDKTSAEYEEGFASKGKGQYLWL